MTAVTEVEGEALAILLMGTETTDLLSDMFIEADEAQLRDLGGGDLKAGLARMMDSLEGRGLVTSRDGWWYLTPAGREIGERHAVA